MTKAETWRDLARRCREATGADFELDAAIAKALGDPGAAYYPITGLIDAVVSLIERELPGWAWKVGTCSISDDAWLCPDFNHPVHGARLLEQFGPYDAGSIWDHGVDIDRRPPGNVALALCEAVCEAKAAIAERTGAVA